MNSLTFSQKIIFVSGLNTEMNAEWSITGYVKYTFDKISIE